ncbi:FAD-binding domain-containing protein [Phanerochaete sordida]|uniref:FAD-binding domain-containing protein n=1 Tax=Phanerochaete sordida TaxID=48140 RepID=A0A9P3G1I6_9APHY|nr:FAD-binding domain-containing protein [Phanerochaete sordida]
MRSQRRALWSFGLATVFTYAPATASVLTWRDLAALNASVGGHLHLATPFALPCFSSFQGKSVSPDPVECDAIQANYTDSVMRSEHFGAMMNSQWETCQATSSGCLLDVTDPVDPAAYQHRDCEIGNIPPAYVEVQSVEHIQAAYNFSRKTGIRLSVKNKGHDYKGRSSGRNTLSLWVSHLNADLMSFNESFTPEHCDASYKAITIGTGVGMQQLYAFADKHSVTAIGGYHKTVATGYFLGGGHSILSPVYGLGVDRVVQIKVVTPDGHLRTASECQDSDLFWALRGGGGSAFGVVTELTVKVEPQLTIQAALIEFPSNSTSLPAWYRIMINNSLRWGQEGWGGHLVGGGLIYVNPRLNNSAAHSSMREAIDFAKEHGGVGLVDELPSWYAFFTKYVLTAEAAVGPEIVMGSRLLSTDLFANDSGKEALATAIDKVLPFSTPYIVAGTPIGFPYVNGTTSVTPAWRSSLWHFIISKDFNYNSTLLDRQSTYTDVSLHTQPFRDLTPEGGAYFNEGDVYEPSHRRSYWGNNYDKLLKTKQK